MKKIHYFSDGCAGQYKNRFKFINIYYHTQDFGFDCECHFFATSHGKNACDGLGGTLKRATARASLQRTIENQILSSEDMFLYCKNHLGTNIRFFHISSEEIQEKQKILTERFNEIITILGTQKFHKFVPMPGTGKNESFRIIS